MCRRAWLQYLLLWVDKKEANFLLIYLICFKQESLFRNCSGIMGFIWKRLGRARAVLQTVWLYFSLSFSPISSPSFSPLVIFTPFLLFILSYMSLSCYSPPFNCSHSLPLISLQFLPNCVTPYFLSLEFYSPNLSLRFLS